MYSVWGFSHCAFHDLLTLHQLKGILDWCQITGDNVLIARETARTLGMGTNILTTEGLPEMGPNGEVPKDLGKKYGKWVLEADGFAQVNPGMRLRAHGLP